MTNQRHQVIADVYLHTSLCGQILYDEAERRFGFAYTPSYLASSPIALSLSLKRNAEVAWHTPRSELPPYFSNLLPEGWLLDVARTIKLDISTPGAAITQLCRDTIGAVAIYSPGESYVEDDGGGEIESESSRTAAQSHPHCLLCHRLLQKKGDNANYHAECSKILFGTETPPILRFKNEDLLRLAQRQLRLRYSVPGVQPKFSGRLKNTRTTMLLPARFIVKPEPKDEYYKDMARVEAATMHFAMFLGLTTAQCGLVYLSDGTPAFITRRFDRDADGGKRHAEDFAQARGISHKYSGSLEQVATFLVGVFTPLPAEESLKYRQEFLQLCLFNYLVGNSDNHLKNYSLLHLIEDGQATTRLAPFYDLFPARAYAVDDQEEIGLTLAGRKADYTTADFRALARRLEVAEQEVEKFIHRFKGGARFFKQALQVMGVASSRSDLVEGYVTERLNDLARRQRRPLLDGQTRKGKEVDEQDSELFAILDGKPQAPETAAATLGICESCSKAPKERGRRRYCSECGGLSDQGKLGIKVRNL